MSIVSVMPSNHLTLCNPLHFLPSIFLSIIVFSNESALPIWWPKYWSFSISPSNGYSELISFRINLFNLVQGILNSLLKHRSSRILVLWHLALFMVQISYPYMTTGKTIALITWTIVGKMMSLLFNMLSSFLT